MIKYSIIIIIWNDIHIYYNENKLFKSYYIIKYNIIIIIWNNIHIYYNEYKLFK